MGNCQAVDNATLVIQHPCGKADKLYWPVAASEIMKTNPGHYVALLLTTTTTTTTAVASAASRNRPVTVSNNNNSNIVRITRIKLLRPTDTLVLGHVYRLIDAQEVMKGLWAKKSAKMKKKHAESAGKQDRESSNFDKGTRRSEGHNFNQASRHERHRQQRTQSSSSSPAAAKSRTWQPSLKSISEAAS